MEEKKNVGGKTAVKGCNKRGGRKEDIRGG